MDIGRRAVAALLCLSLLVWSMLPSALHVPTIGDTQHEHAETATAEGHSHGLERDLLWALHGHGHDAVDHDHNPALAAPAHGAGFLIAARDKWQLPPSPGAPHRVFRIERPPRA